MLCCLIYAIAKYACTQLENVNVVLAVSHWRCDCTVMPEYLLPDRKAELSETSAVLEAFKFIENAAAEFSDEDEEEDSEGRDRTNVESRTVRKQVCPHPSALTQI